MPRSSWRVRRPDGSISGGWPTRDDAIRAAVSMARGAGHQPVSIEIARVLWRSLSGAGWMVEPDGDARP